MTTKREEVEIHRLTAEEIVDLFLRIQIDYVLNSPDAVSWFQMYTKERIDNARLRNALETLRKKWEQSLQYDDLVLRIARLEVERLNRP